MKLLLPKTASLLLCLCGVLPVCGQNKPKVSFENIKSECSGLPLNKRVRISVSSFKVATPAANNKFGDELAQSLTNALQNIDCFNVLLSTKDIDEINDEIAFGQTGSTKAGSSPKTGNMKGAQVVVMGKVTEFSEGKNSVGALGIKVGANKVHIGFIVTLINPETREIIASKSINVDGKGNGTGGLSLLGVNVAGSTSGNKSTSDAVEKGIIEVIEFLGANKANMPFPEAETDKGSQNYSQDNCPLLKASYVPKIMVILPEFHITQRIPDPAAETEINRKLTEAGFPVVDAAMYASIKNNVLFSSAARDPKLAISLGKEFGADVVIYGEAFSERAGTQSKQVSCRARAEIKAVRTDNAEIIAANGLEAGALDNAEFVAAKAALRSAGSLVADYVLSQFCSKNLVFNKSKTSTSKGDLSKTTTEIIITKAAYAGLKALTDLLGKSGKVLDKTLADGTATIHFEHGSGVDVADLVETKLPGKYQVTGIENGKLLLESR